MKNAATYQSDAAAVASTRRRSSRMPRNASSPRSTSVTAAIAHGRISPIGPLVSVAATRSANTETGMLRPVSIARANSSSASVIVEASTMSTRAVTEDASHW